MITVATVEVITLDILIVRHTVYNFLIHNFLFVNCQYSVVYKLTGLLAAVVDGRYTFIPKPLQHSLC